MDQAANRAADWLALTMTRRYAASPHALFRAWTDPQALEQWLGMPGRTTRVEQLEPWAGGAYRIRFSGGDMPATLVHGRFEEVEAPNRLVFSWSWERGPAGLPEDETLVTVTFQPVGALTEMVLTHAGFRSEEWRGRHEHGWNCGLDNLTGLLAPRESFSLTVTRRFAAAPDAVFRAWIDPAQLAQWMGPRHVQARIDALDARVGGAYAISFLDGDGVRHRVGGVYHEIVPNRRLVMSWAWQASRREIDGCVVDGAGPCKLGNETLITVELAAVGKETELTLTHERFLDQAARDAHGQGWNGGFDKLAELLAAAPSR